LVAMPSLLLSSSSPALSYVTSSSMHSSICKQKHRSRFPFSEQVSSPSSEDGNRSTFPKCYVFLYLEFWTWWTKSRNLQRLTVIEMGSVRLDSLQLPRHSCEDESPSSWLFTPISTWPMAKEQVNSA
jgi:hypothetical protein